MLAVGSSAAAEAPAEPPSDVQAEPADAAADAKPKGRDRFFDPQDGQLDLSQFLATPRSFLAIPIVVTEPAIGYGAGLAAMFLRPREEAGAGGWSRPDISAVGGMATQNGTRVAFAGDVSRWMDGRLRTIVGGGAGQLNLDFYALGPDRSSTDPRVRYALQFTGGVGQVNWQLAPESPWSLGVRYVYADVEPQLRDEPNFPGLVDRTHLKVSGPTAILEFDSRDNIFTPAEGAYAESSWLASRKDLGSSEDFDRFQQVLMGWWPAAPGVTVGARADYAQTSSGAPFFLRPFVQLRGVPAMRFQGDKMASLEVEGRWQFSGRWSAVGFAGVGATRSDFVTRSLEQSVSSAGVGFRYELARKFGLHAGFDVAHSAGTTAVYLQLGNAWFRP